LDNIAAQKIARRNHAYEQQILQLIFAIDENPTTPEFVAAEITIGNLAKTRII